MELTDEVDAQLAAHRSASLTELEKRWPEAVAWLVVAPVWTEELARLAGFPAADPEDLRRFLDACEARQWCVRRRAPHGLSAREAAELLTSVAVRLREAAPDDPLVHSAVAAAQRAIQALPMPARRARLSRRLAGTTGRSTAATPHGRPPSELAAAVATAAEDADLATAARALADAATQLPPGTVIDGVRALMTLLTDPEESPVATPYLARAAAAAGDFQLGRQVSEQSDDGRMRLCSLAEVARGLVHAERRGEARALIARIADSLGAGAQADLVCTADVAERIAPLGELAEPVFDRATGFPADEIRAHHVEPLVRLAVAARVARLPAAAKVLAQNAVRVAQSQADPGACAVALVMALPVGIDAGIPNLAREAWVATRKMSGRVQRARLLAALIPDLTRDDAGVALQEIVDLCRPTTLVELRKPLDQRDTFWIPEITRDEVLGAIEELWGADRLRQHTARVGGAIVEAPVSRSIPEAALRWASLAARIADDPTGETAGVALLDVVDHKLAAGATGEAGGWILAGRRLLPVVRGSFEASLLLAERKVELVNRREHDRRLLSSFLPRVDQLAAFEALIDGDGQQWALHYLGHGGVGKTMLMRHLCTRVAPDRGWAPARVDFDHLNPEFPWRRPGQLLLDLLGELEAYATPESRRYYKTAVEHLRRLRWPVDPAKRPNLARAVAKFCHFAASLDRNVLIVLDTCEELAKFQPVDAALPQLEAAFDMLEELHARLPSVRVVFGGRRPLARTGAGGWRVADESASIHLPMRKDYLGVHVIRGFSGAEADAYLTTVEKLRLEPEVRDQVLERSTEAYFTPYLSDGTHDEPTYSPFDLALYAGLIRDRPGLAWQDSAAANTYVANRLIERLGVAAPLLPAAVAMGTFDHDMLAAAAAPLGIPLDDVWPQFLGTDWIQSRLDPALPTTTTFLQVDPGLLPRLQAFYEDGNGTSPYGRARRELAGRLSALVRGRRPGRLAVAHVEGALRCLDGPAAAALCDELALEVAEDGAWMWAFTVFGRLLDPEGALAAHDHPARAAASALYATAAMHVDPGHRRSATWRELHAVSSVHPVSAVGGWLSARAAVLGEPDTIAPLTEAVRLVTELFEAPDRDDRARGSWLLGTVFAGAERLMDQLETEHRDAAELRPLFLVLRDLAESCRSDDHMHLVAGLLARICLLLGDVEAARRWMADALQQLDAGASASSYLAADRPTPVSWRSRVRLRAVVTGLAEPGSHWLSDALDDGVSHIDSGRLASALLTRRLDREPAPRDLLLTVEREVGSSKPPPAVAPVHHAVPSLRVAMARGWLALGEPHRARGALGPPGEFADGPREQAELDEARVDIARRMRLVDSDRHLRKSLGRATSSRVRVVEADALLDVAIHLKPKPDDPESLHLWWRSSTGRPKPGPACDAVRASRPLRGGGPVAVALALDAAELDLLTDIEPGLRNAPDLAGRIPSLADATNDIDARHALRLLTLGPPAPFEPPPSETLGRRRLAELALEEGELLALRLPQAAQPLLVAAAGWFREVGDPVGAFLALLTEQLAAARGPEQTATALRELEQAYADLRGVRGDLPPWIRLVEGAMGRSGEPSDPPGWEGWLVRLRQLLSGPDRRWWRHPQPSSTPELRPASPPVEASRVLRLVEPGGVLRAGTPASPTARRRSTVRRVLTRARPWAVSLLALGVAAIAVWCLFALFDQLLGHAASAFGVPAAVIDESGTYNEGWVVLRFVGTVAGLVALIVVAIKVGTSGPRRSRVSIELGDLDGDTVPVTASGTRVRRWPLPTSRWSAADLVTVVDGPDPPRLAPKVAREVAATAFASVPVPVGWRVPPDLASLSWERALAEELADDDVKVHSWRVYEPLPLAQLSSAAAVPRRADRGRVRIAAPSEWFKVVASACPPGTTAISSFGDLEKGDLVVLMATPVTTTERVLVVDNDDEPLTFQPDELQARDVLVVVCGEPAAREAVAAADQLAVQDLRKCADDLMDAGAEAVVLLPSMPEDLLFTALRTFDAKLARGRTLLAAAGVVQTALRERGLRRTANELTVMLRGI